MWENAKDTVLYVLVNKYEGKEKFKTRHMHEHFPNIQNT